MTSIKGEGDPGIWGGRISGKRGDPTQIDRVQVILDTALGPGRNLQPSQADAYLPGQAVSIEDAAAKELELKDKLDKAVEAENLGIRDESQGLPPCKRVRRGDA